MSIAGSALLPLAYGRLADYFDPLLVPCYLFVLYATYGYRVKQR